jgi:hypothetical protein
VERGASGGENKDGGVATSSKVVERKGFVVVDVGYQASR